MKVDSKYSIAHKIRWAEYKVERAEQDLDFWLEKLSLLKDKYGASLLDHQINHLRKIKNLIKDCNSDLRYWRGERDALHKKEHIIKLMG